MYDKIMQNVCTYMYMGQNNDMDTGGGVNLLIERPFPVTRERVIREIMSPDQRSVQRIGVDSQLAQKKDEKEGGAGGVLHVARAIDIRDAAGGVIQCIQTQPLVWSCKRRTTCSVQG